MRAHHRTVNRHQVHRSATRHLQKHVPLRDYKRKVTAPTLWAVEPRAGGVDRGGIGGSDQQDGPEGRGGYLPFGIAERDVLLQVVGGGAMDLSSVQRMMVRAHGSLRGRLRVQKP